MLCLQEQTHFQIRVLAQFDGEGLSFAKVPFGELLHVGVQVMPSLSPGDPVARINVFHSFHFTLLALRWARDSS